MPPALFTDRTLGFLVADIARLLADAAAGLTEVVEDPHVSSHRRLARKAGTWWWRTEDVLLSSRRLHHSIPVDLKIPRSPQ